MSDMVSHPPTFAPQRPGSNEDLIRSLRDEIARLRAENEQLRWSLNGVSTCIDEIVDPSSPRAIKEFTRAKEFITAALADTADKPKE